MDYATRVCCGSFLHRASCKVLGQCTKSPRQHSSYILKVETIQNKSVYKCYERKSKQSIGGGEAVCVCLMLNTGQGLASDKIALIHELREVGAQATKLSGE
jgi:hypothetical protein